MSRAGNDREVRQSSLHDGWRLALENDPCSAQKGLDLIETSGKMQKLLAIISRTVVYWMRCHFLFESAS